MNKQMHISSLDGTIEIGNSEVHFEQFSVEESLCTEEQLTFGLCQASVTKFRVSNRPQPMLGKWVKISESIGEDVYQWGIYKVYSERPTADRAWKDIVAYDAMYDIINADATTWYNSLQFPISIKDMRNSFFSHMGVEQVDIYLQNDDIAVGKTLTDEKISGKKIMSAICEINGCFGHINREGKFDYRFLSTGLYPAERLFPKGTLFPNEGRMDGGRERHYVKCQYEDYETAPIEAIEILNQDNEVELLLGSGNCYVVKENFLTYGKGQTELKQIAENMLMLIEDAIYTPVELETYGKIGIEVGDRIEVQLKSGKVVSTFILSRKHSGIQGPKETIRSDGNQYQELNINSNEQKIAEAGRKANIAIQKAESAKIEIENNVADKYQLQSEMSLYATTENVTKAIKESADKPQTTANYGSVVLEAVKSTSPVYMDLGSGMIGEYGKCVVVFDDVFRETTEECCSYIVLITPTNGFSCICAEKGEDCFTVSGENGATFDWIVLAKQKNRSAERLKPVVTEDEAEDNIEDQAEEYLKEYEEAIST